MMVGEGLMVIGAAVFGPALEALIVVRPDRPARLRRGTSDELCRAHSRRPAGPSDAVLAPRPGDVKGAACIGEESFTKPTSEIPLELRAKTPAS